MADSPNTGRDAEDGSSENGLGAGEGGDLVDEVDDFLDKDEESDEEDAPDWFFEEGEAKSSDPGYVFCPAPHRRQILQLFTKHFCQHPLFPECDGVKTAECIRQDAVMEMYQFCYQRGLREVWGYMWNSWYSPKMWRLWARSTSKLISRLRTTMGVENFWRQLKHEFLHHFFRPRLDQLVWILINNVTPAYMARAEILEDTHRLGRSKPLTTYQKAFKKSWKALAKLPVSGRCYDTLVAQWTCKCGRQKYHRHHLCKHLVQAVKPPPASFWHSIIRRRTTPMYRHPHLVQIGEDGQPLDSLAFHDPDDGSITDGDDHVWLGDKGVLEGGGGWRDLASEGIWSNKRARDSSIEGDRSSDSAPDAQRMRYTGVDDEEDEDEVRSRSNFLVSSSHWRLVGLQLARKIEALNIRADQLVLAADIIRSQLPHRNRIWISSMVDRDIGHDVANVVLDVQHVERTGRRRDNTWATPGNKVAQRRSRNTMGYQVRSTSTPP
jgi:hypothetical protein